MIAIRTTFYWRPAAWIILAALIVALSACNGKREEWKSLPNGYRYVRTNFETAAIYVPDSQVLATGGYYGPGVRLLGIEGDLVFGQIDPAPKATIPSRSPLGYFVLNTTTHEFKGALSEDDFKKEIISSRP
jgi:hypothetical protein